MQTETIEEPEPRVPVNLATSSRWIRKVGNTGSDTQVVCFPHAGASAPSMSWLRERLGAGAEIVAIQYPGRHDRSDEAEIRCLHAIAAAVAEILGEEGPRSRVLYGHSMGATVAFEVARILQSTSPITHLVVSGRVAPHLSIQGSIRYSGISDEEIVQDLLNLSGTDRTLIGDSDAIGLIMPAVRNDYIALSKYRYAPGVKLGAPVTALVGDRDPLVSVSAASGWRKATTGRFELRLLREAGHFYPTEQLRRQVAGVIDGAAYGDQRAIEKIQRFAVDDISDGIIHPLQTTGTLVRLGGTFDDAP